MPAIFLFGSRRRWTLPAIDILLNNAGITQPLKLMEIEPANYDAVFDVNLRGTLSFSAAFVW